MGKSSDLYGISISSRKSSSTVAAAQKTEGEIIDSTTVKSFSFNELKLATRNFRPDSVIGEGGFGCVFKGWLDETNLTPTRPGTGLVIAVKKLNQEGFQGHRGAYFKPLPWFLRIKVALDAAKGLAFLHSDPVKVIYRDIKASNILLDADYNGKLSDFGLARDGPEGDLSYVSTRVMGTYGYAAPEYMSSGHLNARSDVYSFGVVLLEILSGKQALDHNRPAKEENLVEWARPYLTSKRKVLQIVDARLDTQYLPEEAVRLASIAVQCLSFEPKSRPTMDQVVRALQQLQDNLGKPTQPDPALTGTKPFLRFAKLVKLDNLVTDHLSRLVLLTAKIRFGRVEYVIVGAMMTTTNTMAMLQNLVFSVPISRMMVVRRHSLSTAAAAAISTATTAVPSPKPTSVKPVRAPHVDSQVLLGMSEPELQQLAIKLGQEGYRGKQLHHLIYKRKVKEVEDFSTLPQTFRKELVEGGFKVGRSPIYQTVTATDGTIKLLLKLEDNLLIETVGIPVQEEKGITRLTACVSSQVGCPLRCSFCATGKGGFSRNLKRHEIIEQVLAIEDVFKHRVTNVVFMGMGEPMLNLKSVLDAHRCLNKDIEIGQRMITISTVGVPNTIKKLATHKLQSTLAVSLHAPNQSLREKIVPSAKAYPLEAIMKDCRDYFQETNRRVSFEYALLAGVNDSVEHAVELAELLREWGKTYHVNLIPYNPIEGSEYKRPYKKAVLAFAAALESRKITASVRQTRGLDASAACGQLRNKFQKSPLVAETEKSPLVGETNGQESQADGEAVPC
ncbi:unnamed protein product [Thlaspi arvense]|uniref:Uncharacterized protein n=1 Tax=Thlaspi arvense TaxID=13288 RepID=A0AAU9S5J5_THLAR|nr:unnamed protein product [Thlaspi arvense]